MSSTIKAPERALVELTDCGRTFAHSPDSPNLLTTLESHSVDVQFQCREGYCGACRAKLKQGQVRYQREPLAFIRDGEILLCCSVPIGKVKISLNEI